MIISRLSSQEPTKQTNGLPYNNLLFIKTGFHVDLAVLKLVMQLRITLNSLFCLHLWVLKFIAGSDSAGDWILVQDLLGDYSTNWATFLTTNLFWSIRLGYEDAAMIMLSQKRHPQHRDAGSVLTVTEQSLWQSQWWSRAVWPQILYLGNSYL